MFYFCKYRVSFAEEFVRRLLKVCIDLKVPQHERCLAAGYVGGFISKAKYFRNASSLTTFEVLSGWTIAYIDLYNRSYPFSHSMNPSDSKKHPLFFNVCQALFRIYNHHQYVLEKKWKADRKV